MNKALHLALVLAMMAASGLSEESLDLPKDMDLGNATREGLLGLSANRKFSKELAVCQAHYRARLADVMALADRAEIFLLDSSTPKHLEEGKPEDGHFYIAPAHFHVPVLEKRQASKEELQLLVESVTDLLKTEDDLGGGAWCHSAVHGIRLYKGGNLLFSSSFCWQCQNYFMTYPDKEAAIWVGIPEGSKVEAVMNRLMPVPEDLRARLSELYGSKTGDKPVDKATKK